MTRSKTGVRRKSKPQAKTPRARKPETYAPRPLYYLPGTVYDAALERIRWLFDEFEHVVVSFSGGKDSTVVLNLALQVAREKDRLPLTVFWLDQECEFESTVDYARVVQAMPDVDFRWYQVPFKLFNATSTEQQWLNVWGEGEEWVREKEPAAITENTYGTERFAELLHAIGDDLAPGGCVLTGVRSEESPARRSGLTTHPTFKWATWGAKSKNHVRMHPIYDWRFRDVWKAILDGGWAYNASYDYQYRYGVAPRDMRVSNYHHETAVHALFWLQEVEPQTWEKATARVQGISTTGHLGKDDFFVHDLPYMFRDWVEYRDYLIEHLPGSPEDSAEFRRQAAYLDQQCAHLPQERLAKTVIQSVLANDVYATKIMNFANAHRDPARRGKKRSPAPATAPTSDETQEIA